ncbi:MAG TPA: thioredoxin-like domain-containing protein [Pirellulales bacterium]|nr:thioredoxin-like domain-containing protein [Pirellulales bacterium]
MNMCRLQWLPLNWIVAGGCLALLSGLPGCGRPTNFGVVAGEVDQLAQAPTGTGASGTTEPSGVAAARNGAAQLENPFPNRSPAPALEGGVEWLNTSAPVDLKKLRGKFVLLDFWTYCCINCMHILPELKKLKHAYPNNVVIIGVHSGKFDAEHDSENIRQAVLRNDIEHPVVNDADYKIWNAYHCDSWPSLRLIDPQGNIVAEQGGEIDFPTLDAFFKKVLPYYRQQNLLDEKPTHFDLEKNKAANTPLLYPGKILADEPGGRLFIADSNHNRIVVAALDGVSKLPLPLGEGRGEGQPAAKVVDIIGSGDIGRVDGDFRTATFHHPQGMALHGDTLYVADTENHLLRKIDLKKQRVTTIAGTGEETHFGWPGYDPDSGLPPPERFVGPPLKTALNSPWALSINRNDLYIAMAGAHQIWKMPLDESEIGPYAGNGREDIVDGPLLPKRPYAAGYASFAQPSGLSCDSAAADCLYVADSEGSSIREVPLDPTKEVHTVIGTADIPAGRLFTFGDVDGTNGTARLQHCLDLVYHDGMLYVADTYNNKIKQIDLKTGECKTLAGTGKAGHDDFPSPAETGAGGAGASFSEPAGLTYAAGKLYVADTDNHLIRVIELPAPGDKGGAAAPRVTTLSINDLTPPVLPAIPSVNSSTK